MKNTVQTSTVVELLRMRATTQPDRLAYSFLLEEGGEDSLTYRELDVRARALAARMQAHGASGERALLLYQPGLDYLVAFFACLYAGALAVPAYPPRQNGNLSRLQTIVQDAEARFVLTTASIFTTLETRMADTPGMDKLQCLLTDELADDMASQWEPPVVTEESLAFLQYTSGSTSAPKGVMLSHGNLLHNLDLIAERFGTTEESRGVIWLPPYHDMGLIGGILNPLYSGYPVTLMAPVSFIQRPLRWLQAISQTRATVSGGPNFAYELCVEKVTPEQREPLDLSSWTNAFSGAEPVRPASLARFAEVFAGSGFRKEAFYPCYGLAEGTLFVTGGLVGTGASVQAFDGKALEEDRVRACASEAEAAVSLVSCGELELCRQQIVIADPQTSLSVPSGRIGEIWLSGPSVAQGYWRREEQTAETFAARLADTGAGPFLRTGDLGFVQEGRLYVTGRLKDLIIIRGRNYYPQDLEYTAQESHVGIATGGTAAFSVEVDGEERPVIVSELERAHRKGNHEEMILAVRQAIAEQHQLQVYGVVLLKPASIPKTSSGKIQRHACKRSYLEGGLDVLAESVLDKVSFGKGTGEESVSEQELAVKWESFDREALLQVANTERQTHVEQFLLAKASVALGLSAARLGAKESLQALGLDSLMAVELKNELEERFGVVLPLTRFLDAPNVGALAAEVVGLIERSIQSNETSSSRGESQESQAGGVGEGELPPSEGAAATTEWDTEYPLSYGQQSLWFLQRLAPESAAYHISKAVRLKAGVDADLLQTAYALLLQRHPALQTVFVTQGEQPVQQVQVGQKPFFDVIDGETWSEEQVQNYLTEAAHRPFDLEKGSLVRAFYVRCSAGEAVLLLSAHHLVIDFWSFGVFMKELWALYAALQKGETTELPPHKADYADYVRHQAALLQDERGQRLLTYWQEQLGGDLPLLDLKTDRPRPPVQTYNGATVDFRLEKGLSRRLKALAQAHGVTQYMILLAAFQVLLHRHSGQDDILVGSPTAGRTRAKDAGSIGYYVNPVVLRADLSEAPTFAQFLQQVRGTVLGALDHQEYPFPLLVEKLQPKRDLSFPPIFQAMFTLQRSLEDDGLTALSLNVGGVNLAALGEGEVESYRVEQRFAQLDLGLTMGELQGEWVGLFEYNSDLFDRETIERLVGHFETLLGGVAQDVEQSVEALPLLSECEQRQLLTEWNETTAAYEEGRCIHHLFEAQVERTPDAVAVVFREEQLTYRELNIRANQVAHRLQAMGVGPDTLVGLCMERSLEMMVGLLAILKAGGAYVPLDPTYPQERLAFILQDAEAAVLVTQPHLVARLPQQQGQVLELETTFAAVAQELTSNPTSDVQADNLAYMIYTSGSTGQPKGVMVEHRNAVNFFAGMDQRVGRQEQDTLLAVTSICFDISVLELFWTLTRGLKVVLLSEQAASGGLGKAASRASKASQATKAMQFSLFYFASDENEDEDDKYRLLIEGAKFADRNGFSAVWTPERHFHKFGGLYPSPAVIGGALSMVTERIKLRSGSVVLPLHSPIRVAEDWSVVDNLSRGRVELSFASGWHADDFVFRPQNYEDRSNVMFRDIETVKKLWRGEPVSFTGGGGHELDVRTLPRPVQSELPVWVTSGGNIATFRRAGEIGANVLTHLLGQSVEDLAEKIAAYREALQANGFDPEAGQVALMLHTYVDQDMDVVREKVREPFIQYLRSSFGLVENLVRSLQLDIDLENMTDADRDAVLAFSFERYFETSGLFGTPESCAVMVARLQAVGVDEVACLVDFGVDSTSVLASLEHLSALRERCEWERAETAQEQGELAIDPYTLAVQAEKQGATLLQCTPSLMKILSADVKNLTALRGLRALLLGGEALDQAFAKQVKAALPDTRLLNMYGPTEATVWATTAEIGTAEDDFAITIGRPLANMKTYLLDEHLQPVPVGLPGELHIGGLGVARGYHKCPELTAERFVRNPFAADRHELIYKTGDLASYLPDGRIKFLGRIDHQVKVRGFRIELGEIETALTSHAGVKEAVVIDRTDASGATYLVAYLVENSTVGRSARETSSVTGTAARTTAGAQVDTQAGATREQTLRTHLQATLPDYMVPSAFVFLDRLPLTPNDKVDRKALPDPQAQPRPKATAHYAAPQSELEQTVAAIWQEVLQRDQVGIHDNFFEIGGHSLQVVQMHGKLKERLHLDIPVVELFQFPTVAMLAKHLGQAQTAAGQTPTAPATQRAQERAATRREQLQQRRQASRGTRRR
ncbi:MAG TPA: MupA/Atu3671 family FMN-dependent luciferase-like monooxygenase [Bacilli bacterium]|nr:MupA/Atu3671 family FMN-dependent luciferase-like monooxygenase [Bacilli bacterium]